MEKQLRSFGLTHFQYMEGDGLGPMFALLSLFPIFIVVMQTTIILSRREVAGILFLLGQLLNELVNLVLKLAIKESRPHSHLGSGYGMPSNHGQFMGFFSIFTVMYLETRIATSNIWLKRIVQVGAILLGELVTVSRVYLGYHTTRQVLAGLLVGVCFGLFWYWFTDSVLYQHGWVERALRFPVCQWLLIRDSRNITDVALAEYHLSSISSTKAKIE